MLCSTRFKSILKLGACILMHIEWSLHVRAHRENRNLVLRREVMDLLERNTFWIASGHLPWAQIVSLNWTCFYLVLKIWLFFFFKYKISLKFPEIGIFNTISSMDLWPSHPSNLCWFTVCNMSYERQRETIKMSNVQSKDSCLQGPYMSV